VRKLQAAEIDGSVKGLFVRASEGGMAPANAEEIRQAGGEFGATTGRPRRIGWQDLVALRYAVEVAGIDELAIMKGDVLSGGLSTLNGKIKVCVGYQDLDGKDCSGFPALESSFRSIRPRYETMKLWKSARRSDPDFKAYLDLIESCVGVPVRYVGYGPEREQMDIIGEAL
jgi:adenylosuccinate synthase